MSEYGRLDDALVWEALSGPAQSAWAKWEAAVRVFRREDSDAYTKFEDLVAHLRRVPAAVPLFGLLRPTVEKWKVCT
jgi:hypothetical protein